MENRPLSENSQQRVMDTLVDLYNRIGSHDGVAGNNMLEKYDYFIRHSENARKCTYSLKCQSLFFKKDYNNIKEILLSVLKAMREIEGDTFGR